MSTQSSMVIAYPLLRACEAGRVPARVETQVKHWWCAPLYASAVLTVMVKLALSQEAALKAYLGFT